MKRLLLCTDLDRTLIPNGALPVCQTALPMFRRLADCKEIALVYVTGRHLALIGQAISEYNLPLPDFAIADVGSTIYRIDAEGWRQWDEWDMQIAPDWRGMSHDDLYQLLSVFPALRLQEKEKQNRHKLSFYFRLDTNVKKLVGEMDVCLKQAGVWANLIWSIDEAAGLGLLDVLPKSANKLHAIRFLLQSNGYLTKDVLFAGDSGNDLDVLLSDIPSVLVANANADVKGIVARADIPTCYIAKGGYLEMNGNYSAGILEGVAHYWPEVDAWLRQPG